MTETTPDRQDWLDRLKEQPLQTVWKGLILVSGTSALLSLSELVVKAKGFAVQLIEAYRLLWQEPIQWLARWIDIPWPNWASDVLLLLAVSNAAGVLVTIATRTECERAVRQYDSVLSAMTISKNNDDMERVLNEKFGDYLRIIRFGRFQWPRSFYIFVPIGVLLKYLGAIVNSRWRRESWVLRNADDPRALYVYKNQLDEIFFNEYLEGTRFICKSIISRYFSWMLAFVVFSSAILISSFAFFYLPVSATP